MPSSLNQTGEIFGEVDSTYRMLGLVADAFPYRRPGPRFGRYGSLVLVAPCNFTCGYCDVGGYAKDKNNNLPGWREIPTCDIEQFVRGQVVRERVIYFSGGEPLMFPRLIAHLAQIVRELGGYSVVCSNATYGSRMEALSNLVDEFSISLKGSPASAEAVSGVRGRLAFDLPYQNTLRIAKLANSLELVIVMFDDLTVDTIIKLYEPLFGRADLVLKEYRPKVTVANSDHTYHTELLPAPQDGVRPMPGDQLRAVFAELVARAPQHSSSFRLVMGGGGDQVVATADDEHRFLR